MRLWLSARRDGQPVCVPTCLATALGPCHIDGVRLLYASFCGRRNVVLHNDKHMNEPRQMAAFLTAVTAFPALVYCEPSQACRWSYELAAYAGLRVHTLSASNAGTVHEGQPQVVLVPFDCLKYTKALTRSMNWPVFVVDDVDRVAKSRHIQGVQCRFRVGITHCHLTADLRYRLARWADKESTGKQEEFARRESSALRKLRASPFASLHRHTWQLYEDSPPTHADLLAYKGRVQSSAHGTGPAEIVIGIPAKTVDCNPTETAGGGPPEKVDCSGAEGTQEHSEHNSILDALVGEGQPWSPAPSPRCILDELLD